MLPQIAFKKMLKVIEKLLKDLFTSNQMSFLASKKTKN